jgi:hypothetical protein
MSSKDTNPKTPNSPNHIPETGTVTHLPTRVRRRGRRLTLDDMREVAALCALRASEAQACAVLAIPISSWHHFKARARNSEGFAEMMDAIRGAKIRSHMTNVEAFSSKDWRASIAYIEKILPEQYSTRANVQVGVTVQPMLSDDAMRRICDKVEREYTPEKRAREIVDEIRLGYRLRVSWQYLEKPGETKSYTVVSPEEKTLVLAMLDAEPKQIENAKP